MSKHVHALLRLAALFPLAFATRAHAQCAEWSSGFAHAGTAPVLSPWSITDLDDGNGRRTYVLRPKAGGYQLARWSGVRWDVVFEALGTSATRFATTIDAGVPVIVFGVRPSVVSPMDIWRCDGTTTTQLGSTAVSIADATTFDDGTGPALYACGGTTVLRWNGVSWTQVGATLGTVVVNLEVFDDGTGAKLYAAGGATPDLVPGSSVAVWNGSAWSAAGALPNDAGTLAVFNGELYAGATVTSPAAASGLRQWNGGAWTPVGALATGVDALEVVDFGAGPQLAVGGTAIGGSGGVWLWDGAALTQAGSGFTPSGRALFFASSDETGSTRLHVTGIFSSAGGVGCSSFASTDGASWATIGHGFDAPVSVLARHVNGANEELHAFGTFTRAGFTGQVNGYAHWDGADWTPTSPLSQPDTFLAALSADLGSGPELFAGGIDVLGANLLGVVRWNGATWAPFAQDIGGDVHALGVFDDGTGARLIAGGNIFGGASGEGVSQLVGSTWTPVGLGTNGIVSAFANFDEGAGERLFAGGGFTTADGITTGGLARWDGANWSALGTGITGGVNALCVFDGALYAGGTLTNAGGVPVSFLARWNGTAWSDVPGSGPDGGVIALAVHDDGRGPALYVGGGFDSIGGITAYNLARFDGSAWEAVDGGLGAVVRALASVDDDGDGDRELFVGGDFIETATVASGYIARLAGCPHYASFCFGDGSLADHTTPCPCGNDGAPGHGCASGFNANGALLGASGSTFTDDVVLAGSGFPATAYGLYLQHDAQDDRVFHDGVLCAGGNLLRLRNRNASGGASQFPDPAFAQDATLTLSQRGLVTPGSGATRYYSVFYRSPAATFCPPATANVTNGMRVIW